MVAKDPNLSCNEANKFRNDANGDVCVAVCGETTQVPAPSIGGLVTRVALVSTAWTALPLTPLTSRVGVGVQNKSTVTMLINYTAAAPAADGMCVPPDGERFYDFDDNIIIYGRLVSGATQDVMVEEIA